MNFSLDNLLAETKKLRQEGWTVLHCDDAATGGIGVRAFRKEEEGRTLLHYPLGEMIYTDSEELRDAEQFVAARNEEGTYNCDNPRDLTVGLITYNPRNQRSLRRYLKLGTLRGTLGSLSDEDKKSVLTSAGRGTLPFPEARAAISEALQAEV